MKRVLVLLSLLSLIPLVSCSSSGQGLDVQQGGTSTTGGTTTGDFGTPRGPIVSQVQVVPSQTSAVVTFTTDIASVGQINYGTSTSYGSTSLQESEAVTSHSITLTGLTTGAQYHFQITADSLGTDGYSDDQTFTTVGGGPTGGGSPPSAAPTIGQVNVSSIGRTVATITWLTNVPSTSQVNYGTTTSYGTVSALQSQTVTSHSVTLTGLTGGTLYHFQVSSQASGATGSLGDFTFRTTFVGGAILLPVKSNGVTTLISIGNSLSH